MTDEKNYSDISKLIKEIKSEAIKEFAERLKNEVQGFGFCTKSHNKDISAECVDKIGNAILHNFIPKAVDEVVKEMTEEGK